MPGGCQRDAGGTLDLPHEEGSRLHTVAAYCLLAPWLRVCYRVEDDLGYLPPCGVVAGAEGAVRVAGDDAVVVGGLHVLVEGVVRGHVPEGGCRRRVDAPALGEDDHLAQLS